MEHARRLALPAGLLLCGLLAGCGEEKLAPSAGPPIIDLRAEMLTVAPSTGPVTGVLVRNSGPSAFGGKLVVAYPQGWKLNRTEVPLDVPAGQTRRVSLAIEKASDSPDNAYPVTLRAVGGGLDVSRSQRLVVASAPFFKPTIDGRHADWADAIPASFTDGGKKTTISTYWNRQYFCLLVAVEEDKLVERGSGAEPCDGIQFALAPRDAVTPRDPGGTLQRYELLVLPVGKGAAVCYRLARPGDPAALAERRRKRAELKSQDALAAITRTGNVTCYEVAVPLAAMPLIRPEPGREFSFSLLVHDPDGTGVRDWGTAAGLWPDQRSRLAWCDWAGAKWPAQPPFDGKIEWGFCSSKK